MRQHIGKFLPFQGNVCGSYKVRGHFIKHECAICGDTILVKQSYRTIVGVKRCGGPGWDPLFCCESHTDFEIEVWKVKTNRRVAEGGPNGEGDR